MSLVVNFFAGAGAGKSTLTAGVFAELKNRGINAEIAHEYAKDLVWEERHIAVSDQLYIFAKQYHKLFRLRNKVDVILTDSPLLFSTVYLPENYYTHFKPLVIEAHYSFKNINFFVNRTKPYNPSGRLQTIEEAKKIDDVVRTRLFELNIPYTNVNGEKDSIIPIADAIERRLNNEREEND